VADSWFFRSLGHTWGPFSTPEVKNLAAAGLLQPKDPVWPEHSTRHHAVKASEFLDFAALVRVAVPAPDWLDDVQQSPGPQTGALKHPTIPDWLEDFAEFAPPASKPAPAVNQPAPLPIAEPVEPPTQPLTPPKAQMPTVPPSPHPATVPLVAPKQAVPIQQQTPTAPSALVPPAPAPHPPTALPAAPPAVTTQNKAPTGPQAHTSPVPAPHPPAAMVAEPAAAPTKTRQTVLQLMGFDPQTGQITDPDLFRKWTREQAQLAQAAAPQGKSLQEVFYEARRAVEQWVDEDANRELIETADLNTIRQHAGFKQCLNSYRGYGAEMTKKLEQHLESVVDNRKKFYRDFPQRR
jgi:hypothetical protein